MEMEWEDVDPLVKIVPWAQASVYVNKDEKVRIRLSLSEAMMNACGRPTSADIQIGVRDGKLLARLVWKPEEKGKFLVSELGQGGARIDKIPCKEPGPDGARESEPCEVEKKDKVEAIISFPLDLWQKQLTPVPVVRPQPPPPPAKTAAPPPAAPPGKLLGALDAAAYLKKNGIACHKLAGDWWMIRGEKVPRMEVLAAVNTIRKNNDLPALGIDNIE